MHDALVVVCIVGVAWLGRCLYYSQVFGRVVVGRLRESERKRLLPRDSQASYLRGYRAALADVERDALESWNPCHDRVRDWITRQQEAA